VSTTFEADGIRLKEAEAEEITKIKARIVILSV
jgi:hypothetical protein